MSFRFVRAVCGLLLPAVVAFPASARATGEGWIHGIYAGESPRPVVTDGPTAWRQASNLAEHTARAFVLVGSGRSMQPLYAPGTILVLCQQPFGELKRGQTVLYRNRQRRLVAHVLVARARDGWRTQGLNNGVHDMEPICPENLVGVVIAAYQPTNAHAAVQVAGMP